MKQFRTSKQFAKWMFDNADEILQDDKYSCQFEVMAKEVYTELFGINDKTKTFFVNSAIHFLKMLREDE